MNMKNYEEPSTPNRLYYNYDVTSPYYINITHRRHKPQPSFPPKSQMGPEKTFTNLEAIEANSKMETKEIEHVNLFGR